MKNSYTLTKIIILLEYLICKSLNYFQKTNAGSSSTSSGDSPLSGVQNISQNLRFGRTWITNKKNIDVSTKTRTIGQDLRM